MGPAASRRSLRHAVSAVAAAAVAGLASCSGAAPTATGGTAPPTPDAAPWFCDSSGGGHGGHGGLAMGPDPYAGVVKGELSPEDCEQDATWFAAARAYAERWPTAGAAVLDGWGQVVPYASGMGTHHVRGSLRDLDGTFDGGEPEFLMYDGSSPESRLTGMAWFVRSDAGPPDGFAGDNDWWHQHLDMCVAPDENWLGQGVGADDCAARGGIHEPGRDWWMAHAWILPEWEVRSDVFANHHPCLTAAGPVVDRGAPCWQEADGAAHDDSTGHSDSMGPADGPTGHQGTTGPA